VAGDARGSRFKSEKMSVLAEMSDNEDELAFSEDEPENNQSTLCSWEWACLVAQHGLGANMCCHCEESRVHHLCAIAAICATGVDPDTDSELCYNCYKEQNPQFPLDMTYHPYEIVFAVGNDGSMSVKQASSTRALGSCSVELCVIEQSGPQIQMQWGNRSSPIGEFEKLSLESFRATLGNIVESVAADDLLMEFFPDSDPKARAV
jgi:hypothetical protein